MQLSNDPVFDSFRNAGIKKDGWTDGRTDGWMGGWMDSPRWKRFSSLWKIGSMLYAELLYEKGFPSREEDWVQGNPVKKYKETTALRFFRGRGNWEERILNVFREFEPFLFVSFHLEI